MIYKRGVTHPDVKKIQNVLGVHPTGFFGSVTEKLVKDWQGKHGLDIDGEVGAKTWNIMFPPSTPVPAIINYDGFDINWDNLLKAGVPVEVITALQDLHLWVPNPNILHVLHFLAQCAHESGNWTKRAEGLNYRAERLVEIFPDEFPTVAFAKKFEHNQMMIANQAYANRNGNGDYESGDGWNHRGMGWIELTGATNQRKFAKWMGDQAMIEIMNDTSLIASKYATEASLFYFTSGELWAIANHGNTDDVIKKVTKMINPPLVGLDSRIGYYRKYERMV